MWNEYISMSVKSEVSPLEVRKYTVDSFATKKILEYFTQLSKVPRKSYQLDGVRQYLTQWATEQGFKYRRDTYGNFVVVIGEEKESPLPIIIQSHMDMVCTKTEDSKHDFDKDAIELVYEKNILRANKTTLGADNGVSLCASQVLA